MYYVFITVSNCIHSIGDLLNNIFSNFIWILIIGFYVFLPPYVFFLGIVYAICSIKKVKKRAILSFLISLVPVIICVKVVVSSTLFGSVEWSMKRFEIEKKNEVLFRIYDENAEDLREKCAKIEIREGSIIFRLYGDIYSNDYVSEYHFVREVSYALSAEERSILDDMMQYDTVIIVDGNEIIYEKVIKNKNPEYCPKMYKVKYNRAQEYRDEYDRAFKDRDRKWCVEEYYIGEGKTPRTF